MRIIKERVLYELARPYHESLPSLNNWMRTVRTANWQHFMDVRADFATASPVGNFTVFNIGGNKYRLITLIDFEAHLVFIRGFLTHAEYDREGWKANDPWYRE